MKKLFMIVLLLLISRAVSAQVVEQYTERGDTLISGTDTTIVVDFSRAPQIGYFQFVYINVQDTGSTFTDSIGVYNITATGDTVPTAVRRTTDYTDQESIVQTGGLTRRYLVLDAYIRKLYIVLLNQEYVEGRRVLISTGGITYK